MTNETVKPRRTPLPPSAVKWAAVLCLPHLITMILLLPAAPLWLLGGVAGLAGALPYLETRGAVAVAAVLILIAAAAAAGWKLRRKTAGRRLVSFAVWLWFALGFFCLSIHY